MDAGRMRVARLRGIGVGALALVAALALIAAPAQAKAATPLLEFVTPGSAFPVGFTATGGQVSAALAGFDSVVSCSGSHGSGAITGPRSTLSDFSFTGCKASDGALNGQKCKSTGASEEEIVAEEIEADLVFIDQSRREVGMLLNPGGGLYMSFACGGEDVEASGPFLAPVGPLNQQSSSFTATMTRQDATQTPGEYENALGEKRLAIPLGKRAGNPTPATTGVALSFAIQTSAPLQIKAVTGAEIEAEQRSEEIAATIAERKLREEQGLAAEAEQRRKAEQGLAAEATQKRQQAEAELQQLQRKLLAAKLKQCRKAPTKHQRVRCEKRAKRTHRP